MTETQIVLPPVTAQKKMSGLEKAATLLLAVGKDNASKIMGHLSEDDVRAVARCASDLRAVPQPVINSVLQEFVAKLVVGGGLRGSAEAVEALLSEIMPDQQVRQIMNDIRARMNEAVWPRLAELSAHLLAQFLAKEHPQVITFVLAKTPPSLTADIVSHFSPPPETRS